MPLRARLSRLAPYFGYQRWTWVLAILATIVVAGTEPAIPALLKPLLDQGFTGGTLPLWAVPVTIVGVFFIRGLAQFINQYALARIANDGMMRLRENLFGRVLDAHLGLFTKQSASALSNTVVYEVQNGSTLIVQALLMLSRDGFTVIALLMYLLYLNWQLTLIVAVLLPSVSWIMKKLSKRLYHITKASQQATDEPGLCGRGERARAPHGAHPRRPVQPVRSLPDSEPQAAPGSPSRPPSPRRR